MIFQIEMVEIHLSNAPLGLQEKFKKDFEFFLKKTSKQIEYSLCLDFVQGIPDRAGGYPWRKRKLYNVFNDKRKRHLFYDEKLYVELDFSLEKGTFYFEDEDLLYEMSYLFILSRVGRFLEKEGLFKIHACAVCLGEMAYVFPMPMKGGKTTLFLSLLAEKKFSFLSDDAPVVDQNGEVSAFPLRVGLQEESSSPYFDWSKHYLFKRRRFGMKYLLPISAFHSPISERKFQKIILFKAERKETLLPQIFPITKWGMLSNLFINFFLGLGLPYAREFYLEGTSQDLLRLFKTAVARGVALFFLLKNSKCYKLILSSDIKKNAQLVSNFGSHQGRQNDEGRNKTSELT